jgi:two-component system chemotaxis response regulator CheB
MIVDDAVVVRGLLARWLEAAGGMEVVAVLRNGSEAVATIDRVKPDVVLLDVEMPNMDGAAALPQLLRKWPSANIIVSSAVPTGHAEIFIRCLQLGAADCIAKPKAARSATFRREIVEMVQTLGLRAQRATTPPPTAAPPTVPPPVEVAPARVEARATVPPPEGCALRPMNRARTRILAIGASTGGPNAVTDFLRLCGPALEQIPVIVTQHMPKIFTTIFAEHLQRQLSVEVSEAAPGDIVRPGRVLVAPGGRHLRLVREGSSVLAMTDEGSPVNFCRPSVDVLFGSVAAIYGASALAVILTGMGADGLAGAASIIEAGGNVFAQDQATSVVWGMPGAVAKRGLCAAIEPVEELARLVRVGVGVPA